MANLAEDTGGAVPPLAFARTRPASDWRMTLPKTSAPPEQSICRQRLSRLCVLMNPILPGARSIWDLAGEILEKTCSCGPDYSGETQEVQLRVRQLTNRRMRTFIATPSARNVNNTEDPP